MEQSTKDLWIHKLKQGRVLVIQSALAPLKKDCLWFKNGALYVYGNRGWEDLGVGDEPTPLDPKYVPTPIVFDHCTYIPDDFECPRAIMSEMEVIPGTAVEFQPGSYLTVTGDGETRTFQASSAQYFTEESDPETLDHIFNFWTQYWGYLYYMGVITEEEYNTEFIPVAALGWDNINPEYEPENIVLFIVDSSTDRRIFMFYNWYYGYSLPNGFSATLNAPNSPTPTPEPEPSDRVYVPVPTELAPFESVTYEYDDHTIFRGTEKSETRDVETRTATISYVTVPDNAAGFEVTENLCLPIYGTYESASEAKSTTPFVLYPYWEHGATPEELIYPKDPYYDHIVGIMTSLYDPDGYEILHYDRFWDADRHFEAHTWTAKVFESGSRAKVEKTKLFVTVGLSLDTVTIDDALIQFYNNDLS